MRVMVDGLPLLGEASLAVYLRGLLTHLAAIRNGHEYVLFFRTFRSATREGARGLLSDPAFAGFSSSTTMMPNTVLEWCWTRNSFYLPFTESWLGRPDVFISTIYVTPVLRRTATVMLAYDLIPLRFPQSYGHDQPLLLTRIRRSIERSAAIIAISNCTKRDYVELLGADPARIHVVYPGVDPRFIAAPEGHNTTDLLTRYGIRQPFLLYVGVLAPHKNVDRLIRIFRQLKKSSGIPHQLVLCGQTRWGQQTVHDAQDLVATGDCAVLDYVQAFDLPSLYQAAQAFVSLSLYEGFGLPPLESMACGTPVVVSNAGSLPEVVGDAGIQVSPTDDKAIGEALYEVLVNADLQRTLRARGLEQASKFSWPVAARKTLDILKSSCGAT